MAHHVIGKRAGIIPPAVGTRLRSLPANGGLVAVDVQLRSGHLSGHITSHKDIHIFIYTVASIIIGKQLIGVYARRHIGVFPRHSLACLGGLNGSQQLFVAIDSDARELLELFVHIGQLRVVPRHGSLVLSLRGSRHLQVAHIRWSVFCSRLIGNAEAHQFGIGRDWSVGTQRTRDGVYLAPSRVACSQLGIPVESVVGLVELSALPVGALIVYLAVVGGRGVDTDAQHAFAHHLCVAAAFSSIDRRHGNLQQRGTLAVERFGDAIEHAMIGSDGEHQTVNHGHARNAGPRLGGRQLRVLGVNHQQVGLHGVQVVGNDVDLLRHGVVGHVVEHGHRILIVDGLGVFARLVVEPSQRRGNPVARVIKLVAAGEHAVAHHG